ncbi:MAG: pseudouridine-5'-phosphate glycosidase, partial [Firmicutes bacterium]|nr:pseudouridine-5'-phosphate glycosidase [Bacillota bacterium]
GKKITPYLLSKVKDLTEGRSLEANIKLVLNNASVGAEIAKSLAK